MKAIETKNLTKRYGKITALDGLDLAVSQGELVALLGINGAGKTTAIKILSGLTLPDVGEAWLGGHSILGEAQNFKRVIGVSPQETAIAKKLTVRENLQFIAEIHGLNAKEAAERVEFTLKEFGLNEMAKRRAGTLSGGWQRRLSIAMALISGIADKVIPDSLIAFGELGLAGEVRAVSHIEYRVKEAVRLGFTKIILPKKNLSSIIKKPDNVELVGVENIYEVLVHMTNRDV